MASRNGWRAVALGLAMAACGILGSLAFSRGMWGSLAAAVLCCGWLASVLWWHFARLPVPALAAGLPARGAAEAQEEAREVIQRLLLDAVPTPLVVLEDGHARAFNSAARRLFGTDDRILPLPRALADPAADLLVHEGKRWRIDRVAGTGIVGGFSVAALIDVEGETSLAEARASAELIEILGHELLNGLAPIVSLAESAQQAARSAPVDTALLGEILGPLARRAEGLQRFAEAYRQLARLPDPEPEDCDIAQFVRDLEQGFIRRWPGIAFGIDLEGPRSWPLDRDQLNQALWALLQNAAEAVEGQPHPEVRLRVGLEGERLVFAIRDTGPGVAPAVAAHIFRPFHSTKPGGSGIGLSLARQIARSHRGTLDLAGADPTLFRLALPRTRR